jgi:CRISPR/Cas system-associated exonuclease Cas4 (RecB family)
MIKLDEEIDGGPFRWSNSRHGALDDCPRKYGYTYYGVKVDPEVDRLKNLNTFPLWAGHLVHDTAEAYIKTHDKVISEADQETLIKQVTHGQMPQDWNYSLAQTKRFRLFEHEYNQVVSVQQKRDIINHVANCLRNLFKSEILAEVMADKRAILTIEDLLELDVKGYLFAGKMDLAYRRKNGKVHIVDWKSGKKVGKFNLAQVGGYALYAFRKGWATKPEDIETTLAYLAIPEYKTNVVDAQTLVAAQDFIHSSARKMESITVSGSLEAGNKVILEHLPPDTNKWKCGRCQYLKICTPGQFAVKVPYRRTA